ncbi:MAG: hypothetical protein HPY51_18200 [Candidatus Omnitrophica bacterium]|nr:hypothetical protein [Candidatus Omnitrophota bacterium]
MKQALHLSIVMMVGAWLAAPGVLAQDSESVLAGMQASAADIQTAKLVYTQIKSMDSGRAERIAEKLSTSTLVDTKGLAPEDIQSSLEWKQDAKIVWISGNRILVESNPWLKNPSVPDRHPFNYLKLYDWDADMTYDILPGVDNIQTRVDQWRLTTGRYSPNDPIAVYPRLKPARFAPGSLTFDKEFIVEKGNRFLVRDTNTDFVFMRGSYDPDKGYVLASYEFYFPGIPDKPALRVDFNDFRLVEGIWLPGMIVTQQGHTQEILTLVEAILNQPVDAAKFELPATYLAVDHGAGRPHE